MDDLADFVVGAEQSDLSGRPRALLKRNVLYSIACAVGSLDGELVTTIRAQADQFSGVPTATLVGGGRASVDQAAFFNTVLVRYPDLLDT
ncbi:MAG: MmgE/PrpD family protein, partial [Mycobacterium sp.]|uniref:MmgE/PrpD family protein n=1 Tax=Mycobacterium sp. TaxID=1785 RepID=UPI001EC2D20F|nr:MmgE/PrpD family protein [Mycobacterium sp.]